MTATPLQIFLREVENSASHGYAQVSLLIHRGKFEAETMDSAMVSPGELDKLYLAAEVHVASHSLRDRIVESLELVRSRYLDLWRCILMHQAGFMQDAWNEQEMHDDLQVALDRLRKYRDVEAAATESGKPKHSIDFRSVDVGGIKHEFTENQAACIKFLWEAFENGTPSVGEKTILEQIESSADRLRDVFKTDKIHPAWGSLICPGKTKGSFQIILP